jgi:hypothetical protein
VERPDLRLVPLGQGDGVAKSDPRSFREINRTENSLDQEPSARALGCAAFGLGWKPFVVLCADMHSRHDVTFPSTR